MAIKYAKSTVSNQSIRNILGEISLSLFDEVTDDYLFEAAKFFDFKCPYTGEDLKDEIESNKMDKIEKDHIMPINKDHVGLNVRGNVVYVRKSANNEKSDKPYDEFLNSYGKKNGISQSVIDERINKIKAFQKEFNYDHDLICKVIADDIKEIYEEVRLAQEKYIKELISKINKSTLKISKSDEFIKYKEYVTKCISDDAAYSYTSSLKKVLVIEGITSKDLDKSSGLIDKLIEEYSSKGSKYNPQDHGKIVNALRKYAEFKGIIISNRGKRSKTSKYINVAYEFKIYLTKVVKTINAMTKYFNTVQDALTKEGLDFDTITLALIDDLINDYSTGGKRETTDVKGFYKAALKKFKSFLSSI